MEKAVATAVISLKKLKDDEKDFANISSAAGGAKLARECSKMRPSPRKC
jgi:hypothetical protein